jgi:hypothetical protein
LRLSRQLDAETRLIPGSPSLGYEAGAIPVGSKERIIRGSFGLYNRMLAAKVDSSCNYRCMGSQSQARQTITSMFEMHPSNETTKSKTGYHWLLLAGQQQDEETSYH